MLQLIKEPNIDFIGRRRVGLWLSLGLLVAGLVSFPLRGGLRLGVEFTGGLQIEVVIANSGPDDIARVRAAVGAAGYDNRNIQRVQASQGTSFLIHLQSSTGTPAQGATPNQDTPAAPAADQTSVAAGTSASTVAATSADAILGALRTEVAGQAVTLLHLDSIGPKVGGELRLAALQAILLSVLLILVYLAWRFEFLFGVATVVALAHDLIITLGLFALFNKEMSLSIVAAFLTLAGYSVNDTIVIFDRIREELKQKQRRESVDSIFNGAINKTLSRTLLTSVTTMLVLVALYFYGGDVLHDFAWVLMVGVLIGTYSSVFVAAPLCIVWYHRTAKMEASRASA